MFNKLTCLLCDWRIINLDALMQINDGLMFSSNCPKCGGQFWKWENDDCVRVTLNGDYLESEK